MKKVIFLVAIVSACAALTAFTPHIAHQTETTFASDFCDGWEDGFEKTNF